MKTQTFTLPAFWASALINGDESGLEPDEQTQLDQWLKDNKPGYCIDVSSDESFTQWHDARDYVLACDCAEFTFQIIE